MFPFSTSWQMIQFITIYLISFTSLVIIVIMSAMASQITTLTIVYSNFYPGADQRKHQSSVSLAFVRGIHRWAVNSTHKGLITRKMFPFDDVMMWADFMQLILVTNLYKLQPQTWHVMQWRDDLPNIIETFSTVCTVLIHWDLVNAYFIFQHQYKFSNLDRNKNK